MLMWRSLPSATIVVCLRSLVAKSETKPNTRLAEEDARFAAAEKISSLSSSGHKH